MDILKKLFYGKINPFDEPYAKDSSYAKTARVSAMHRNKLLETMTESQKELSDLYDKSEIELERLMCCDKFAVGFQLGVALMARSFVHEDE